jgi:L-fucose isomerase-like protein
MNSPYSRFAVVFANRGFFPPRYIDEARTQLQAVIEGMGHQALVMPAHETPLGAVETPSDGKRFREFFRAHRDEIDGVILSLPNFGDENGALEALREVDVPILIQAYPDEMDRLGPKDRRDSFCGKLSIMDVFFQANIRFTSLIPHTVHPESSEFAENLSSFHRTCQVVRALRGLVVGAIGARTTPFKTVRVDEIALQRHGITVETMDLSAVFARMDALETGTTQFKSCHNQLEELANWKSAPPEALNNVTRLKIVLEQIRDELNLDAMALRCWTELQQRYGISPCVVTGELANKGLPAACEVDIANAVVMFALQAASGQATSILDWNNNYGDDPDKCILFHCGNVPTSLMKDKGTISDHEILANSIGANKGFGCNQGRIREMEFTYSSMITDSGRLKFYLGTGRITNDPIPSGFFGCAGVAEIRDLQNVLNWLGKNGHRHHVCITPGNHVKPLREAFENYLGYDVSVFS